MILVFLRFFLNFYGRISGNSLLLMVMELGVVVISSLLPLIKFLVRMLLEYNLLMISWGFVVVWVEYDLLMVS